jgi:ABC-type transport system substrate-binding protein
MFLICRQGQANGIKLNINSLEWNSFLEKVDNRDFDAVILAWSSSLFPNPKQIWDSSSQQEGGSNFISYSNPKVDELIKKANFEFNPSKRNELMRKINKLIYLDQPYTFLTEPKSILEGINSKIKSYKWKSEYDSGSSFDLYYMD